MDLRFKTEEYSFGVRAACIIYSKDGSKMLAHVEENSDHIALPGGGVKIGEQSLETVRREIMEELGLEVKNLKIKGTLENFFNYKDKKVHGLEIIYEGEFVSNQPYQEEILDGIEERDKKLQFKWVDINNLDSLNFKPNVLRKIIKEKKSDLFHTIIENKIN